mgnify:CR=1 FL=1
MALSSKRLAEKLLHIGRAGCSGARSDALTSAQWAALRFVAAANRHTASPGGFARFHGVTKGTASQTVRSLVGKGLVESERLDQDGRARTLRLTPAGARLLEDDPMAALACAVQRLEPKDRERLQQSLDQLGAHLNAVRSDRIACGVCASCRHRADTHEGPRCTVYDEPIEADDLEAFCEAFDPLIE